MIITWFYNYKDALSSVGNPGVTRVFPHITGVDVAGEIVETKSNIFKVGQKVIVTGYDLGMNTNGGTREPVSRRSVHSGGHPLHVPCQPL